MNIPLLLLNIFLVFIFFDPQLIFKFLQPLRLAFFSGLFVFLSAAKGIFENLFKNSQSWLIILFYLLAVNSAVNSIDWDMSKDILFFLLKCILLYFSIITIIKSKTDIEKFVWTLVLFSAINIIVTLVFNKLGIGHLRSGGWRLTSYFKGDGSSSNGYAMLLVSFLPFQFFFAEMQKSKKKKYFLIASIFAFLLGILRTRSRMGFGAVILASLFILWDKRKNFKLIIIFAISIVIVASLTHKRTWERFDTISSEFESQNGKDMSLGKRMEQWKIAIDLLKENPFFGTGINTFLKAKEEDDKYFYDSSTDMVHIVHNGYLQIATEMGVFSLIIYCLVILISLKDIWSVEKILKERKEYFNLYNIAKSIRISLVVFASCLTLLSEQYNRIIYILFALTVSLKNIYKDEIALEVSEEGNNK